MKLGRGPCLFNMPEQFVANTLKTETFADEYVHDKYVLGGKDINYHATGDAIIHQRLEYAHILVGRMTLDWANAPPSSHIVKAPVG